MFKITSYRNGRRRVWRFETIEAAQEAAAEIFKATGVIVAIERV